MRPYALTVRGKALRRIAQVVSLIGVVGTSYFGAVSLLAAEGQTSEQKRLSPAVNHAVKADALTRSAFAYFYELDYDKAITTFEKLVEAEPSDPFAANHLLQAVLFQELYRLNLLDTTIYAQDSFLQGKPAPEDRNARRRINELMEKALRLSSEQLKQNPNDVEALYCRGATRGLKSTYLALVDKSFLSALKNAVGARRDHERVLQLNPDYIDAKTLVGAHNYVIGKLPLPVKVLAGIAGLGGSKDKGLEYLAEAGEKGRESSIDAKIALALFLRREARWEDALRVVRDLRSTYPRNFLFAMEESRLLKEEGKLDQSAAAYRTIIENAQRGHYPAFRIEQTELELGDVLRAQKKYSAALLQYESAAAVINALEEVRRRAILYQGEMNDILNQRAAAMKQYQLVITADSRSSQADLARKYMRAPYREN